MRPIVYVLCDDRTMHGSHLIDDATNTWCPGYCPHCHPEMEQR